MERKDDSLPALREDVQLGTLRAESAASLVDGASKMAHTLAQVIDAQGLWSSISGRRYVRVEGWTTLATMLGCVPREVANQQLEDGSYVATVELVRMADGVVLSRATAECGTDESRWASMPRYARRSMAATRATGKACRLAFSWIMALAGYEATPAEEVGGLPDLGLPELDHPGRPERRANPAPRAVDVITEPQAKRFFAITRKAAEEAGWNTKDADKAVRAFLESRGIASSKEIPRAQYDELVDGAKGLFSSDPTAEPGEF